MTDPLAQLEALYKQLYFAFGRQGSENVPIGHVLPELRRIAAEVRRGSIVANAAD